MISGASTEAAGKVKRIDERSAHQQMGKEKVGN
jgi:hypothetical protein